MHSELFSDSPCVTNYILALVLRCSLLHNMASDLPIQSHLLFFTNIISPKHFYTQAFVYAAPSFWTTLPTICSHESPTTFSKTILRPPPKSLGNPFACAWLWHTALYAPHWFIYSSLMDIRVHTHLSVLPQLDFYKDLKQAVLCFYLCAFIGTYT